MDFTDELIRASSAVRYLMGTSFFWLLLIVVRGGPLYLLLQFFPFVLGILLCAFGPSNEELPLSGFCMYSIWDDIFVKVLG